MLTLASATLPGVFTRLRRAASPKINQTRSNECRQSETLSDTHLGRPPSGEARRARAGRCSQETSTWDNTTFSAANKQKSCTTFTRTSSYIQLSQRSTGEMQMRGDET